MGGWEGRPCPGARIPATCRPALVAQRASLDRGARQTAPPRPPHADAAGVTAPSLLRALPPVLPALHKHLEVAFTSVAKGFDDAYMERMDRRHAL